MSIRVLCPCKRLMILPQKYAGEHVQCPDCQKIMRIPTEEEDRALMRWYCECGQRLKARTRMTGRSVTCPSCKVRSAIPAPEEVAEFIEEQFTMDAESGIVQLSPPGENTSTVSKVSADSPTALVEDHEEDRTVLDADMEPETL